MTLTEEARNQDLNELKEGLAESLRQAAKCIGRSDNDAIRESVERKRERLE